MRCLTEELFTLKVCQKCGGPAIWKVSRYADGCLEQCMGCGEMFERPETTQYAGAVPRPPDRDARIRILEVKGEHEAVRVYTERVEECIRDGERVLNSPGEEYLPRLRRQAVTLYYTLAYLSEAARRHEEKEEQLFRCYLAPDLAEFISGQHEEIRTGLARATEIIGRVLPGEVDKNKLQEFCVSIRRILEPLFTAWREHLNVVDAILDTLRAQIERVEQPA
jgi:hypothetical protein